MKKFFDLTRLYAIQAFKYLVENGITREEAAKWIEDVQEVVQLQQEAAVIRPDQDENNLEYLKSMPTLIIVYKGRSPMGDGDRMVIVKDYTERIDLDSFMQADAVHIINFTNIKKQIDARLEE